jgi:hypothetical protein
MAARQRERSAEGLYVAAQGLHNDKSHNHNDCGNFIIYLDGEPAIIDVGVETYTARTFSGDRYSIWTMQSAYHNLPTINGVMQKNGRQYAGRDVQYQTWPDSVRFSLDIAGAYPPEAGVASWHRTISMDRKNGSVSIAENYELKSDAKEITLSLMTPCEVAEREPGQLVLTLPKQTEDGAAKQISIRYDSRKLTPRVEMIDVKDNQLKRIWGSTLRRVLLTVAGHGKSGSFDVQFSKK